MSDKITYIENAVKSKFPEMTTDTQVFGIKGKKSTWLHVYLGTCVVAVEESNGSIGVSEVFPEEIDFSPHDRTYQDADEALGFVVEIISRHRKSIAK